MTTKADQSILVNVPVSTAYNQWTQFEDFPQFMSGVKKVTQLSDDRLQWVAEVAGVRREVGGSHPRTGAGSQGGLGGHEGATNAGVVSFEDVGGGQTRLHLSLEYEPEGLVEQVGDRLDVVERQAKGDLERFKEFIESEGYATGAWRGSVNEGAEGRAPTAADAAASQSDSGKAGISGKAVAAGAAVAAAGVAAAASMKKKTSGGDRCRIGPDRGHRPTGRGAGADRRRRRAGGRRRARAGRASGRRGADRRWARRPADRSPPGGGGGEGAAPSEAASRGEPARTRHRAPVPCGSDKACLFRNELAEAGQ